MVYPPGAEHPVLYQQVGSPAHTPTSPLSASTPPVSPHAVQLTGAPQRVAMSPVREPTSNGSQASTPPGRAAGVNPPQQGWFSSQAVAAFKAVTGPIGSGLSDLSERLGSARSGPKSPRGGPSSRPGDNMAADSETLDMPPGPPPPTPPSVQPRRTSKPPTAAPATGKESSPKSGSSGRTTPKSNTPLQSRSPTGEQGGPGADAVNEELDQEQMSKMTPTSKRRYLENRRQILV